ncbi:MAG: hypothetical protein EOL87_00190 [Spartobacteria bacterium]|nr:hypothetical protein [Spartobacteria bacterium]
MNKQPWYYFTGIALVLLASTFSCLAMEPQVENIDAFITVLQSRFTPEKPTVCMNYDVTYRFLGIRLARIARAQLEATEGAWQTPDNREIPACMMIMTLKSCDLGTRQREKSRVWLNDRIVSVVTMPSLDTLYYIKDTDEYIRPILGQKRDVHFYSVYNLEGNELDYYEKNYVKNTVKTQIEGASALAGQGREVAEVLRMLSEVYHGLRPMVTKDSDYRLLINCDGKTIPFAAETQKDELRVLGETCSTVYVDVELAEEAPKIKNARDFEMWATSFKDASILSQDPVLIDLSNNTLEWAMTPLVANYGMGIGYIHTEISELKAILHTRSEDVAFITKTRSSYDAE